MTNMHGSRTSSNLGIKIITIYWLLLPLINCLSVPQCGVVRRPDPAARIVGGAAAAQSQYPWMAMLLLDDVYHCDGTVIDHWHVITAAHCVKNLRSYTVYGNGSSGEITSVEYQETALLKVIVGKHYYSTSVQYAGEQRVDVAAAIAHKRYSLDAGKFANDLAILRLARRLSFNERVSSLCLPKPSTKVSDQCTVSGWGQTNELGGDPSQLMSVTMPAYNRSACVELQTEISADDIQMYEIDLAEDLAEHAMCLASKTLREETCYGDSGGPIFCLDPSGKHYELIGVVSWGYGHCPAFLAFPSVQTYVTPYLVWIKETLDNLDSPCATARCPISSMCTKQGHTFECVCKSGLTGSNCDKCGQNLTNSQGSIASLNYPQDYPESVGCEWTIVVPIRSTVNLTFQDMFVEDHKSCDYDFIEIRRETAHGELLAKLCGSFVPAPIVSNTSLYVHFHSDGSNVYRGFRAYYTVTEKAVPHVYLTSWQTTVFSPNYPSDYPVNQDLRLTIVLPRKMSVTLTFLDLDIEPSPRCKYDYVEVREDDALGKPLAVLCGPSLPAQIVSYTSLYVHFVSDDSKSFRGFKAYYRFSGCSAHGFGENCTQNCSCVHENTLSCDPYNGTCQCKAGWARSVCADDVNECLSSCGGINEICRNYPGGFNCSCSEGTARNFSGHCAAPSSIRLCDRDKVQQICNSSTELCVTSTGQVVCMTRIVTKARFERWLIVAIAATIGALMTAFLAALMTVCICKRTAKMNVGDTEKHGLVDNDELVDNDQLPDSPSWQLPTTYLLAGCGAVDKNTGPVFELQGVSSFVPPKETL